MCEVILGNLHCIIEKLLKVFLVGSVFLVLHFVDGPHTLVSHTRYLSSLEDSLF